jgi:glucokinase
LSVVLVVGLDNGATVNNATVADSSGRFLVEEMVESPSRVQEGSGAGVEAIVSSFEDVIARIGVKSEQIAAVGLGSPGPASAAGVLSSKGATNFGHPSWRGFDLRGAVEERLGLPVTYINDGNAAALYAHQVFFGDEAPQRSSVSVVVGTGLGGGVIEWGRVVKGATGTAGELGHVHVPTEDILASGQPLPRCNCGFRGDAESLASLSGIENNLLPYWLSRFPNHELAAVSPLSRAARMLRSYAEMGDEMALRIFEQQAAALGAVLTIASNVLDPDAYFVGGGVVQAGESFRDWFLRRVRAHTRLRAEAAEVAKIEIVPDLDMAGARGAALAALEELRG